MTHRKWRRWRGWQAAFGVVVACSAGSATPVPAAAETTGLEMQDSATIRDGLIYSSTSGRMLGEALQENETHLKVDLERGTGTLVQYQPSSDSEGEPLGTFRAALTTELLGELKSQLAAVNLRSVPGGQHGGPGVSAIRIQRMAKGAVVEASFGNRDLDTLRKLRPLLTAINDVTDFVAQSPYQAILLSVEVANGTPVFTVKLRNVGTEVVALPDLAALASGAAGARHGFGVRVAARSKDVPGVTPAPLRWKELALESPQAPARPPLRLQPGQELTFRTRALQSPEPGQRYLVQARLTSYAGPAAVDGDYVIRGRAHSSMLEWVP